MSGKGKLLSKKFFYVVVDSQVFDFRLNFEFKFIGKYDKIK